MSRNLEKLRPAAAVKLGKFLLLAAAEDITLLITCVDRTHGEQAALYSQGRTTPGKIVTNAKPGYSFHEYGCAIDVVPMVNGKPLWQVFISSGIMHPVWARLGELAAIAGVEWSGSWKGFKEYAHFQYTGGLTIEDLLAGKEII